MLWSAVPRHRASGPLKPVASNAPRSVRNDSTRPLGRRSLIHPSIVLRNAPGSSFRSSQIHAVIPCLSAFHLARSLPSAVRGPVPFFAFSAFDFICDGDVIVTYLNAGNGFQKPE